MTSFTLRQLGEKKLNWNEVTEVLKSCFFPFVQRKRDMEPKEKSNAAIEVASSSFAYRLSSKPQSVT